MKLQSIQHLCLAIAILAGCCGCGGGAGSGGSTAPATATGTGATSGATGSIDQPYGDAVAYSNAGPANLASATEAAAVTHHQITVGGSVINYTATAGHLTAKNPGTGVPEASFFYVAYTADNSTTATRPLTFFLSGGPGTSQAFLHLGAFAPRRIVTNEPSLVEPTTPQLVDNADSLIDTTDMVFIDEVGTGYSEAIAPNTNSTYWATDSDAAVFADFVTRYLTVNQRSSSPLFLYGQSYGTARGAIMANLLAQAGVKLNGLIVNSSVLNFNTNCNAYVTYYASYGIGSCTGELPSYAATAAFYNLSSPAPSALPTFLQQVRSFDSSSYTPAVAAYLAANTALPGTLISQLTGYTGIGSTSWQAAPDMNDNVFRTALQPGMLLGFKDARVAVPIANLPVTDDPSDDLTNAPFGNAFATYLNSELKYSNSSTYAYTVASNANWLYTHAGKLAPDLIPDLSAALAKNASLQILSLNGYYDLITPFYQTELDLARLNNTTVQFNYYAAGHDTYLDNTARPLMKADMQTYYQSAAKTQ